jgi:hypothetical protein
MDPIHPIVPQAPRISPVNPSPGVTRAQQQRDQRRRQADDERRRRERREPGAVDEYDDAPIDVDGDDDGHPHIDITA